jgi:hypothetical protein
MTETHHVAASAIQRISMVPPAIWIISGPPGKRRHEVTGALLEAFDRAAHIDGDALAASIVSGNVRPGDEPRQESERQVELSVRNQCLLARSYAEAGFTPVIEYAVMTSDQLDAYRHYLTGGQIRLVVALEESDRSDAAVLLRAELAGLGMWPEHANATAIIKDQASASVS